MAKKNKELTVPGLDLSPPQDMTVPGLTVSPPEHKARVSVGKPKLEQDLSTLSVGAPASADTPAPTKVLLSFSEFYGLVGGDKVKAESALPGITTADGHKLLEPGPDGKPHVQVDAAKLQQLQDDKPSVITAKFQPKPKEPDFLPPDQVAQRMGAPDWAHADVQAVMNMYPGIDKRQGRMRWVRTAPDGSEYLLNPMSEAYKKQMIEMYQRGPQTATDESF